VSRSVNRGDGVGIEVCSSVIRGVRLRHDVSGRLSTAAELPFRLSDDDAALDAFVVLRAELGEPFEPTRIAVFPANAMMQRIDVTGRSGPEMNELRSRLDRRHGITSTVVADDGPRRWLLVIRWDAHAARRLEDLAERAGFVDVTVEPSPMALARVSGPTATYARRLVAQGDSHHFVVSHGLPVAALAVSTTGRSHPDLDIAELDVPLARYEDYMSDAALGELLDRVNEQAGSSGRDEAIHLDIVGEAYPHFPPHDHRSAQRQAVALGAAVGAAGLAGPLRPVDVIASAADSTDEQFDRPWALEALSTLPEPDLELPTSGRTRLSRRLRPGPRR
jgi:hypothetical protein